jgi:hypothetical protein
MLKRAIESKSLILTLKDKKREYMSLYNLVTDNFKEYDFDTEYCLNIYITHQPMLKL